MAYHIIGLDRGTCAVKAVILEKSFRGYEVKGTRMVPVPQDGGAPPGPEAIQAAVAQLVEEFDPGAVGYVTDFPGRQASTWFLQLPFNDQKRIDQTLPFELENYVPFDLEDMILDYRVVRSGPGRSRVLAALASRAVIREGLQLLKGARVDPRAMLLDASVLSLVPPGKEGAERPIAIIDLGHCQTLVTVRLGSTPDFLRSIPLGGLHVTQSLMAAFGVNYRTAELLKHRLEPVVPLPDPVEKLATEPAVATEVARIEVEPEVTGGMRPELRELAVVNTPESGGAEGARYGLEPESPSAHRSDEGAPGGGSAGSIRRELELRVLPGPRDGDDFDDLEDAEPAERTWLSVRDLDDSVPATTWAGSHEVVEDNVRRMVEAGSPMASGMAAEATEVLAELLVGESSEAIRRVVWEAMTPVVREIRNALMAYEGTEHQEIAAVMLVGGGAMLPGVSEVLGEELGVPSGIPVRLGPDQTSLGMGPDQARFALPFILAYLGTSEGRTAEINFRKGEFSYRKNYQAFRVYLLGALALAAAALLVLSGMFVSQARALARQSASVDAQISDAIKAGFPELTVDASKGLDRAMALMLEDHVKLQERGRGLGVGATRRRGLDVLKEVSAVVPAREEVTVDVEDFNYAGEQVKMRGTVDSFESMERIEKALESSAMVSEAKSDVSSKGDKKSFNLTITLKGSDDASGS